MRSSPDDNIPSVILVVHDEVLVRAPLTDYLRECGYQVFEAANGEEAVNLLSARHARIDVVLCKAELTGGMNGFNVKKWTSENMPETVVLLFGTTKHAVEAAGSLCEEGPTGTPPFDPQVLENKIRRALGVQDRNSN